MNIFHNTNLRILCWNCHGLIQKYDEFIFQIENNSKKYDILILIETFFTEQLSLNILGFTSHNIIRQKKSGGGISIYCSEQIPFTIQLIETIMNHNIESITIQFKNKTVVALYRPPKGNILEFLDSVDNMLT